MSDNEKEHIEEQVEVIDFQSEDRSDSQPVIKPVPASIKWMLVGFVVVIVVGGLYLFKDAKFMAVSDIEAVQLSDDESGVDEIISLEAPEKSASIVSQKVNRTGLTLAPAPEQYLMNERVTSMETQIEKMTQQIESTAKQNETVNRLTAQVDRLSEYMRTVVTTDELSHAQQSFRDSMQQFRNEIQTTVAKRYKKKTYTKRKKATSVNVMPFKLVSIDQWDDVYYAAIQSKKVGAIENLRVGDRRSGWKVEKIDTTELRVIFKNIKTGQSVKQTVI